MSIYSRFPSERRPARRRPSNPKGHDCCHDCCQNAALLAPHEVASAKVGNMVRNRGYCGAQTTKKSPISGPLVGKLGTPGPTRTAATRFRKPLLYPLSYRGAVRGSCASAIHYSRPGDGTANMPTGAATVSLAGVKTQGSWLGRFGVCRLAGYGVLERFGRGGL